MNVKLILNIISSVNGGLITAAALLQTLFGQDLTIKIVAVLGIGQIVVSAINSNLSTQQNLVKDVAAMPGVQNITVNGQASQVLAQAALDPSQNKVGPAPGANAAIKDIAKGGN